MPDRYPLRGLLRGALLIYAGLWGACAPPHPLQVEYAGCAQVFLPGPVCALEKHRRLRFWVGQPPEVPVEIRAGGRRLNGSGVAVQGGQFFVVEVPPEASNVELRAATPQGESAWSLAIVPRRRKMPGMVLSRQAHDALNAGDHESARNFLVRAMAAHHAAGSLLDEADDATILVWIHIQQSRFAAARQVLSGLQLPAGSPSEAVYYRSYYSGMLAEQTGDARSALAHLEAAVGQAERVGRVRERYASEQLLARQLQTLGQSRKAIALYDRLRRTPSEDILPCDVVELLTNQAWSVLLAGEAGQSLRDPIPLLEEEQRVAARAGCPGQDEWRLNHLLNLTLAHLQAGRLTPARVSLSAARVLERSASPLLRLWSLELEARLELAEGRPEAALQLYHRLDELAASALAPEGRWRAAYGRARCYRALGRRAEALAALGEAESRLDEQSLQIPIQEGRERFVAQREAATRLYLELLLGGGGNAEALEVARRSRSRVLRQLARGDRLTHLTPAEQRRWDDALAAYWKQRAPLDAGTATEWRLPTDQLSRRREARAAQYQEAERSLDRAFTVLGKRETALPALHPGELVLSYHPLPRGWVGFAADGQTVALHRFELPESVLARREELAARLLVPFQAQIERARRVRVLPYGTLRTVDFHALPFRDDILLAALPVVYGLDLVPSAEKPPLPGQRALVVGNPLGDLPAATQEANAVAATLQGQQPAWSTEVLRGEEASADRVRLSLIGTALLHYAGHATFSGSGGWESVLPLAGGTRLTLSDLLALRRVPHWVVLSGCETGRSSADAPVEGLGMAHAFLLAGSRAVIAATRPVGDRKAQELFAELYRHWGSTPDLAVLLRDAQLASRQQRDPAAVWESFRVFEP